MDVNYKYNRKVIRRCGRFVLFGDSAKVNIYPRAGDPIRTHTFPNNQLPGDSWMLCIESWVLEIC